MMIINNSTIHRSLNSITLNNSFIKNITIKQFAPSKTHFIFQEVSFIKIYFHLIVNQSVNKQFMNRIYIIPKYH